MSVELEEMIEFVREGIERARESFRSIEGERKRELCLVAGWEGDPLKGTSGVLDLILLVNWVRGRRWASG